MRNTWILSGLAALAIAALTAWVVHNTTWVEVEVDDPPRGAATQPYYALRQVLAATGSTLEIRSSLEPLPPIGATLVLASAQWTVFPERDALLKAWVEAGGDLVVGGASAGAGDTLKWIPMSFAPSSPRSASSPAMASVIRPLHVEPTWQASGPHGTLAMRVPVGRGSVTATSLLYVAAHNRELLADDNALTVSTALHASPGRAVWIVNEEKREPLPLWVWHQARTPLLLATAATLLALWRLMVRFGPRQALPPRARRSMGEQVRGTGQFIAANDPQALHAATRQALAEATRVRIEGGAELGDAELVDALAARLAPALVLDKQALAGALRPGPKSTPAQWLAAIALVEQARRALLRAPAGPTTSADAAGDRTP